MNTQKLVSILAVLPLLQTFDFNPAAAQNVVVSAAGPSAGAARATAQSPLGTVSAAPNNGVNSFNPGAVVKRPHKLPPSGMGAGGSTRSSKTSAMYDPRARTRSAVMSLPRQSDAQQYSWRFQTQRGANLANRMTHDRIRRATFGNGPVPFGSTSGSKPAQNTRQDSAQQPAPTQAQSPSNSP